MTMAFVLGSLFVLAAGGLAPIALFRTPKAALSVSMLAVGIAALLISVASVGTLAGVWAGEDREFSWWLPFGTARFAIDGLSAWFLMTIGVLAFCVAPYAAGYIGAFARSEPVPAFGALMCVLIASLIVVVCSADAVLFLIGWEAMTLSAFFLISFHHNRPVVRHGAWIYLIATHLGTALCVIPLFALLAAKAETTAFAAFEDGLKFSDRTVMVGLFALGVLGFGTKAGFLPMHVWLPAAHPVAPTPVSALLSGVVVKTGIYGLLRLLTWMPPLPAACGRVLLAVGVMSGVMGVLYALCQHDIKRLLAYHTVENIGIIVIGISVGMLGQSGGNPAIAMLGYTGALLHVTNHALFKGLLFLSAGAVLHGTGTVEIERLGGLARKTPINAAMFLAGAVAICGLPPLNGFVSEWVIYGSLFSGLLGGSHAAVSALGILSLALMGGLALACFVKVYGVVFLGRPRDASMVVHPASAAMILGMAPLAASCVAIGLAAGQWVELARPAAGDLAGASAEGLAPDLANLLAWLSRVSVFGLVFIAVTAALIVLRSIVRTRKALRDAAQPPPGLDTWACGYSHTTARMQYSATSFAMPIVTSFRGLLWPERSGDTPKGMFPERGHVELHVVDLADHDIFRPLFRGAERAFAMIRTVSWSGSVQPGRPTRLVVQQSRRPLRNLLSRMVVTLRRGAIHVHLTLMVVTLLMVLTIEGFSQRRSVDRTTVQTQDSAISGGIRP